MVVDPLRRRARQQRLGLAVAAPAARAAGGHRAAVPAQQNTPGARAGTRGHQLRPRVQSVLSVRQRVHREDPEGRQSAGRAGGRGGSETVFVQLALAAARRIAQN